MFLAWREIRYAKLRYFLVFAIMALITSLVFMISGLANGLASDNASAIMNLPADYYILGESDEHRLERSTLSQDKIEQVTKIEDTNKLSPLGVKMETLSVGNTDAKVDLSLFAIDPKSIYAPEISEGIKLNHQEGVVVDASLKDEGISIGDKLHSENSGYTFNVSGFTKESYSYGHTPVVFLNLATWESLQPANKTIYQAVLLDSDAAKNRMEAVDLQGFDTASSKDILSNVPGYSAEQGSLTMMIVFLLVIAAFVLAAFFYVITLQKLNQFGILKAIGTKTTYLVKTLMLQIVVISVIGIGIGTVSSFGLAAVMPEGVPFVLSTTTVLLDGLLILSMSLLGSLLSLRNIAKVDPVEAIGGVK